jgi:hypothetical protein
MARIALAHDRAAGLADSIARLEQALATTAPAPRPGPCDPVCGCLTSPPAAQEVLRSQKQHGPHRDLGPLACSLDGGDRETRLAEWHDLFAGAIAREPVEDGIQAVLPAALAGRAAELAAAEQRCCPFFRFTLVLDDGRVQATVQAPPGAGSFLVMLTDDPGPPASLYGVTATEGERDELRGRGRARPVVRGARVRRPAHPAAWAWTRPT